MAMAMAMEAMAKEPVRVLQAVLVMSMEMEKAMEMVKVPVRVLQAVLEMAMVMVIEMAMAMELVSFLQVALVLVMASAMAMVLVMAMEPVLVQGKDAVQEFGSPRLVRVCLAKALKLFEEDLVQDTVQCSGRTKEYNFHYQ
jgi:hypothetical protein